jgi:hypothetical protein
MFRGTFHFNENIKYIRQVRIVLFMYIKDQSENNSNEEKIRLDRSLLSTSIYFHDLFIYGENVSFLDF